MRLVLVRLALMALLLAAEASGKQKKHPLKSEEIKAAVKKRGGYYPDFFLLGQQKCGTSSLYYHLRSHPNIKGPRMKETFALNGNTGSNNCDKFDYWKYLADWFPEASFYEHDKVVGDFTTSHFACMCCHKAIHQMNPNAKIMVLLRDPIERSISRYIEQKNKNNGTYYYHNVLERYGSMRGYFEAEAENLRQCKMRSMAEWHECVESSNIIGWSMYDIFLSNIFKTFPSRNILILFTEDLDRDAAKTLSRVEKFLGLITFIPKNVNAVYNTREKHGWFAGVSHSEFRKRKEKRESDTGVSELCSILSDTYSNLEYYSKIGKIDRIPPEWIDCKDYLN